MNKNDNLQKKKKLKMVLSRIVWFYILQPQKRPNPTITLFSTKPLKIYKILIKYILKKL